MSKTSTAAVKVTETTTEAVPEAREVPLIKPANVQLNDCGQVWRTILVRAPEGMCADDLRSPGIWKTVQSIPQVALIKLDRLLVLGFDELWAAKAIVKHATNTQATLLIQKVFGFASVGDKFYSDGTLEIFWDGGSYGVRRISDKMPISKGHSSEGLAIDALRSSYPKTIR